MKLPMLVTPRVYTPHTPGGYLLNDEYTSDGIFIDNPRLGSKTTINDNNVVYDLVNNINGVGYKINRDVFNFVSNEGDGIFKKELVVFDLDKIQEISNIKIKDFKGKKLEEYQATLSKITLQKNILGIAKVFMEVDQFFIPVRLDSRGRLYCTAEYLNYQSTELAKSLLLFRKGEMVSKANKTAISYLKVYGANCYGNKIEKMSGSIREKWVDDNHNEILNFRDGVLLSKADSPFLFLAFCFEYERWVKCVDNPDTAYFETFLPIQLDATCNGYQHLALLSLDNKLAEELNLTPSTWDDKPKDFYTYILHRVLDNLKAKLPLVTGQDEKDSIERLLNFELSRSTIKKSLMTIPYNVTALQIVSYLKQNYTESKDEPGWYYRRYIIRNFTCKIIITFLLA